MGSRFEPKLLSTSHGLCRLEFSCWPVFLDNFELSVVERRATRGRNLHEPLATAALEHFKGSVMTERIVTALAK